MTDQRPPETPAEDHDEFHSSLEMDDSSGWRVLIVPVILILLVIGMVAFFFLSESEVEPDPRVQAHLERKAREAERSQPVQPAPVPAIQPEAITPSEDEAAQPTD